MACVAPEGLHDCMGCQTDSNGQRGLPCELCYLLMAQHCRLCLNVCFNLPTAPHLPPPPSCLKIQSVILQQSKKLPKKPGALK